MIIDIHTHLGDILNPGGVDLIFQENIRKQIGFDMISFSEFLHHSGLTRRFDAWLYEKTYNLSRAGSFFSIDTHPVIMSIIPEYKAGK